MKIVVKYLQGQESVLEVSSDTSVFELKQLVASRLGIPINCQKLLFVGNLLTDDNKLKDCAIREGSVLEVIKKEEIMETTVLRDSTYRFLRQYYNESDSKKIVEQFMKRFNQSITTLSLDDLERIATSFLQDEEKL